MLVRLNDQQKEFPITVGYFQADGAHVHLPTPTTMVDN